MQGGHHPFGHNNSPALANDNPVPSRTIPKYWRRRSADVGRLPLATKGLGQSLGGDALPVETIYAELLSDMYTETINSVNDTSLDSIPAATPDAVRSRLIRSLSRWHFEPQKLPDEEVLASTLILFESLFRIEGMADVIPVDMKQITAFIHHLRRIYRYENTYHNFEHALDVLQATHCYLRSAGIVPPPTILFASSLWKPQKRFNSGSLISCLGLRELFVLYIAAIGHDVGHPGFTNLFMKNAGTPLSLVFDHTSALEQMHYQLLKQLMRHHGLGVLLDDPVNGKHIREMLRSSVIFTDMGIHKDFMAQFKRLIDGEAGTINQRQTIICQALLKNADISNPSRPFYVSAHWAKALMQEWSAQANLEQEYDLQPTVMSSADPIKVADSQIGFIKAFVKPMLQLTVKAIPEMACYLSHLKENLRTWERRRKELSTSTQLFPSAPQRKNDEQMFTRSSVGPPPVSAPAALPPLSPPANPWPDPTFSSQSPPPSSNISFTSSPGPSAYPSLPRNHSDAFMTVFPLTLPTFAPKKYQASDAGLPWVPTASSSASSESRSVSEHEAGPLDSPSAESGSESQPSLASPISVNNKLHQCRAEPSHPSLCSKCGGAVNSSIATTVASSCPDANGIVYPIWYSPTGSSNASSGVIAADDELATSKPHAAIKNASRLDNLRQRRQRDAGNAVCLKDSIVASGDSHDNNCLGSSSTTMTTTTTAGAASEKRGKGVRYSWCVGMAGLDASGGFMELFQQYQQGMGDGISAVSQHCSPLSRVSSDSGFSPSSSPEIPSKRAPSSFVGDTAPFDEDETITSSTFGPAPHSVEDLIPQRSHSPATACLASTPRLSQPIMLQTLRVRSP